MAPEERVEEKVKTKKKETLKYWPEKKKSYWTDHASEGVKTFF